MTDHNITEAIAEPVADSIAENITQAGLFDAPLAYAQNELLPRIYDLFIAPSEHPEMLWTLGPMLVALVLMQL